MDAQAAYNIALGIGGAFAGYVINDVTRRLAILESDQKATVQAIAKVERIATELNSKLTMLIEFLKDPPK